MRLKVPCPRKTKPHTSKVAESPTYFTSEMKTLYTTNEPNN